MLILLLRKEGVQNPLCIEDSRITNAHGMGRFPTNVILTDEVCAGLDKQSGLSKSPDCGKVTHTKKMISRVGGFARKGKAHMNGFGDSGGASRFFLRVSLDR